MIFVNSLSINCQNTKLFNGADGYRILWLIEYQAAKLGEVQGDLGRMGLWAAVDGLSISLYGKAAIRVLHTFAHFPWIAFGPSTSSLVVFWYVLSVKLKIVSRAFLFCMGKAE